MHQSAMFYGRRFFEVYCPVLPAEDFTIVEIGSQNVNGSLREVCPADAKYIGIDLVEGDGVDVLITDPYQLPLPDVSADMVVSSSCFEHSEFFWLVFLEAMRILKPNGVFYLNAPTNGFFIDGRLIPGVSIRTPVMHWSDGLRETAMMQCFLSLSWGSVLTEAFPRVVCGMISLLSF